MALCLPIDLRAAFRFRLRNPLLGKWVEGVVGMARNHLDVESASRKVTDYGSGRPILPHRLEVVLSTLVPRIRDGDGWRTSFREQGQRVTFLEGCLPGLANCGTALEGVEHLRKLPGGGLRGESGVTVLREGRYRSSDLRIIIGQHKATAQDLFPRMPFWYSAKP